MSDCYVFLQTASEEDKLTRAAVRLRVRAADQRLVRVLDTGVLDVLFLDAPPGVLDMTAGVVDVLAGGRADALGHAIGQLTHGAVATAPLGARPRVHQVVCIYRLGHKNRPLYYSA